MVVVLFSCLLEIVLLDMSRARYWPVWLQRYMILRKWLHLHDIVESELQIDESFLAEHGNNCCLARDANLTRNKYGTPTI